MAVPLFDKRALSEAGEPLFSLPLEVRFQDVDAAGIVFFARIGAYFHDAHIAYLNALGLDMPRALSEGPWIAPLKHAEADFFEPMRFGDRLESQVVAGRAEGSELVFGFRLVGADDRRVRAVGQQVHVWVGRDDFKRCPLPEAVRAALREPAPREA